MNIVRSSLSRFNGVLSTSRSGWVLSRGALDSQTPGGSRCGGPLLARSEGAEVFHQAPWGGYQQVRTKKRGCEYQPKNLKRKRTHGWIKRISTWDGVEVILRRMLKGRKSLTH